MTLKPDSGHWHQMATLKMRFTTPVQEKPSLAVQRRQLLCGSDKKTLVTSLILPTHQMLSGWGHNETGSDQPAELAEKAGKQRD